ncbi:hypothetical protein D3C87_1988780 [compost metagenome]
MLWADAGVAGRAVLEERAAVLPGLQLLPPPGHPRRTHVVVEDHRCAPAAFALVLPPVLLHRLVEVLAEISDRATVLQRPGDRVVDVAHEVGLC